MGRHKGWELEGLRPVGRLDLRLLHRPLTSLRTSRRLHRMAPGEVLEVWLREGAAVAQLPTRLGHGGHRLLKVELLRGRNGLLVWVQKGDAHARRN